MRTPRHDNESRRVLRSFDMVRDRRTLHPWDASGEDSGVDAAAQRHRFGCMPRKLTSAGHSRPQHRRRGRYPLRRSATARQTPQRANKRPGGTAPSPSNVEAAGVPTSEQGGRNYYTATRNWCRRARSYAQNRAIAGSLFEQRNIPANSITPHDITSTNTRCPMGVRRSAVAGHSGAAARR